jgi:hypothetical protein
MIPPWMNWYAILTMATPLVSLLGVEEIITLSRQAMAAEWPPGTAGAVLRLLPRDLLCLLLPHRALTIALRTQVRGQTLGTTDA